MITVRYTLTKLLGTLLLFSVLGSVYGQTHFTKRFSSDNGLLSSDNYMTCQDQSGFLWISSHNGLTKFDGSKFTYFTEEQGLPINDVWYLNEDSLGRLWIGGYYDGAYYIKDNQVHTLPNAPQLSALLFTHQTGDTLFFTALSNESFYYLHNVFYENITDDSVHYISTFERVSLFLPRDKKNKETGVKLENVGDTLWSNSIDVKNFLLQKNKQFIKMVTDSLIVFGETSMTVINAKEEFGVSLSKIQSLSPSGEVYIRTNDIIRVYGNLDKRETDEELGNMLSAGDLAETAYLLKDNEGNLWATLYRGEVVLIPKSTLLVKRYYADRVSNDNNFRNPVLCKNEVYVSSLLGNLYCYSLDSQSFSEKINVFEINIQKITGINRTANGIVLKRGLNVDLVEDNKSLTYQFRDGSQSIMPTTLGGRIRGDTFISCSFNKYLLNRQELTLDLVESSGLLESKLNLIEESQNYYISGGVIGLYFYNKKSKEVKKIFDYEASSIYQMGSDVLVGTNGKGLLLLDSEGKTISSSFLGYSITAIQKSGNSYYLATNKGVILAHFNESSKEFTAQGIINVSDGLTSNEITGLEIDSQSLYVTTINGLNIVDYKGLSGLKRQKPRLKIESIILNDSIEVSGNSFNHDENNFIFNYSSVAFTSLGNVSYKYKLNGKSWSTTMDNSVIYKSLPAGNYTFSVLAISANGTNSDMQEYKFSVKKHFVKSWWFRVLMFIVSGIGLWYAFTLRQKAKTKVLLTEKKFADLELKALQSQMNPHFVFNSLNSIQSSMLLQDERETNKYIGEFSRLMRMTLDNSKAGKICLEDEMKYLELYLILEKRRLSGNLNFSVTCSNVNASELEIPTMIFQPLVENAIIHGLIPKTGNRDLKIVFGEHENFLVGEVIDNGIGRKKAMSMKKKKDYKSWGSTILKERIEVINRLNQRKIEIYENDLDSSDGSGTHIIIKIPLE